MLTDDSLETTLRWRARLEATVRRFDEILDELDHDEADWAPDDGIASAREHVLEVADAARRARRRLEDGFEPKDLDLGTIDPGLPEVLLMLDNHHQSMLELLVSPEELAESHHAQDRLEDLILDHISTVAHHAAAISILRQLIDPSRPSALNSALPRFSC